MSATSDNRAKIAIVLTRYVREENTGIDDHLLFCDAAETMDVFFNDRELMIWAWDQTEPADHRGGRSFKRNCQLTFELARRNEPAFIRAFQRVLHAKEEGYISMCFVAAKVLPSREGMALINQYQYLIDQIRSR